MPKTKQKWVFPKPVPAPPLPPKPVISQSKPPTVFCHINVDHAAYLELHGLLVKLNTPHSDPTGLTLEELHLLNERCSGRLPSAQREVVDLFFSMKKNGPIKIPGVGALRSPHNMGELINLCIRFALDNIQNLPLPDHTTYSKQSALTYFSLNK